MLFRSFRFCADDTETQNASGRAFLPAEILWRRKEAFSDGVSKYSRSLFEIIHEYVDSIELQANKRAWQHMPNAPTTREQIYYRTLFEKHYPLAQILPHFWMPKYVNATDASARTLHLYARQSSRSNSQKHVHFEDVL